MSEIPELWWSPSGKALWEKDDDGYFCPDYEPIRFADEPPADAVRLVAAPQEGSQLGVGRFVEVHLGQYVCVGQVKHLGNATGPLVVVVPKEVTP